jgi:sec-independent protein translocase protein TatC
VKGQQLKNTNVVKKEEDREVEMSFLDHLEVLRWHIVRSVIALGVFSIAAFMMKSYVFDYIILAPKDIDFITYRLFCQLSHLLSLGDKLCFAEIPFSLINISMSGQFTMHIVVSIVAGLVITFPYLLFEVWTFIKPALHSTEKKYTRGVVFFGSLLFMVGVLFGYYLIAPLSVQFLGSYQVSEAVANQISLSSFITTLTTITLACGLIFQLPLLVYFLSKLGILTPDFMKKYRRHSIIAALILSAIITPPDVSSQVLVTLPLVLLYEMSIYVSKSVEKRKAKQALSSS